MFNQENILIELTPRFWNQLEFRDGLSLGLGEGGGGEGAQILKKKKKKSSMCVHKEKFQFAPKHAILDPSLQKKKIINWPMKSKSICSILSLMTSCLKSNYNNLWIITTQKKIKHKFGQKKPNCPKNNMNYLQTKKPNCL